ncbi:hypothetical protein AMAG_20449 [Allomyces macrogynus ATCC 38327]|uniref:Uncharacterized protein n=1 Tax=Allomyces macrogynus (strain ATCC 38327) TaxID=578462 RepID=A0A0L0TAT7_ALLM3|nr:hypothetical protein AMAG_20449 [Allomyces macrogynus ATCC 38327]|eukprot:KNE71815.1 hypothetical protein AMAG_20449 [Allomyces macrogynus ATCC 38327]
MAALGDAVLESVDVHQLAEYLQELIATNGILKRELAARDDTIRQLTAQLDDQHEHAAGLDHALKASKRTLKALHAKLVSNEKVHAQERAALDHDLATLRDRCRRLHGGIHLNRDASPVHDDAGYSSSGWTTATSGSPIDADGSDDGRMSRANTTTPEPPSDGDALWAAGAPPVPPLPDGTPPPPHHAHHHHHLRSTSPPRRSPSAGYPSKPTSRHRSTQASFPDPRVAALTDANRALERKLHETALNLTLAQAALHNAESAAFDRARDAATLRSDVLEMQRSLESLREQNEGYKLLLEEKTLNGEWHVDDWAEHARNARLAVAVDRHVVRQDEVGDDRAEDTLGIDEGDVPDHDDPMDQWGAMEGEVVGESLGAFFGGNAPDEASPVGESLGAFFGPSAPVPPTADAPTTSSAPEPAVAAAAPADPAPDATSPRPRCPADSLESELARAALNSENDAQIAVLNSEVKALQLYISTILTRIMDASPSDDEEHDHDPAASAAARARSASRLRRRISRPPGRRGTSSKPTPVAAAQSDRRTESKRPPLAAGLMTSPHGLLRSNDDPEANALESSLALAKRSAPLPSLLGNWRTPNGSAAPSPAASRRSSTGHSHLGPLVDAPSAQAADAPAELAAEHYFRPAESELSFDDPNALATVTPPPSIAVPPPPPSRAPTTREPSPAAQPAPPSRTASTTRRRGSSRTRWRTRSPVRHADSTTAAGAAAVDKDATGSGMEAALRIAAWFSGRQWAQQQKQHSAAAPPTAAPVPAVAPDAVTVSDTAVPPPPPAPVEEELPLDATRAAPDELEALIAPPPPAPVPATSAAAADSDECPYDESTRRRLRSPATSPARPASKYRAWAFMRRLHGSAATPPPDQQPPPIPEEDDTEPATPTSSVAGDAATVAAAQAAQRRIAKTRTRRPWSAFLGGGGSSRRSGGGADRTPPTSQVEAESSVPRTAAGGRRGSGYDEDDEADDDELRMSRQAIAMATAMAPVPRFDRSRSPSVEATTSAGKLNSAEPPVPAIPAAPLVMSPPASIVEEEEPLQRQLPTSDQSTDGTQSRPRSLLGMLGASAAAPPSLPAAVAPATTTDGARPSILRDSLARSVFPAVLGRRRSSATSSSATLPTPEPMSPPSVAASSLPSPRLGLARPFAWTGSPSSGTSTPPGPPPPLPPRRRSSATAGASAESPSSTAPATPVTPATAVLDADVAAMTALTLAATSPAESTVLHAMARAMATSAPRDPFRWARGGLGAGAGAGAGHGATAAAAAAMMGLAIRPGMVLAATSAAAAAAASSAPGMHLHAHANANPWAAPVHPMPNAPSHAPTEGP